MWLDITEYLRVRDLSTKNVMFPLYTSFKKLAFIKTLKLLRILRFKILRYNYLPLDPNIILLVYTIILIFVYIIIRYLYSNAEY